MSEESKIKTVSGELITDPSSLTTQQLWRESASLEKYFLSKIMGIEKAIDVAHQDLVRVPTEVQKAVGQLKELHDEKFSGIAQRFIDNKTALDAAFKNQQDVMTKSEAGTTKQIDAQALLITNLTTGLQLQINDLKERVLRSEGSRTGQKDFWGYIVAAVAILFAAIQFFNK